MFFKAAARKAKLIKVIFVSFSFVKGGAAIAAQKFKLLLQQKPSEFIVTPISQSKAGFYHFLKRLLSFGLVKLQRDGNPIKHSLNLFSYPPVPRSFQHEPQAVHHLHWINNDTLSIFDFGKIPAGSVITLHDEWLYCGVEHYYNVSDPQLDFVNGYSFFKKGLYLFNWSYVVWQVKKKKLLPRKDLIYTVPSKWMLQRARSSYLLQHADVRYLPNPIDTQGFTCADSDAIASFRHTYCIGNNEILIAYGAIGGKKNPYKGGAILDAAVAELQSNIPPQHLASIVFIDFGGAVAESDFYGFRSISIGHIKDPAKLALLYSAADLVVVPSIVESFGQVAAEALSCGTPVVCFDCSGLKDIVISGKTGLLAEPFDVISLAQQLLAMTQLSAKERQAMGENGRAHVLANFSFEAVAKQYVEILQDAVQLK